MLRYDARWLVEYYAAEPPVRPGLPYSLLGDVHRVDLITVPFHLVRATAVEPCLPFDETLARLVSFDEGVLQVQRCRYSDGIRSNHAMDGAGELRDRLREDYGPRLPPFTDPRLSNGIGTAIVVFDRAGKPYLPRRAPRQSIFPGGFHCTASGDTIWRDAGELFEANICRELEEEVGLTRSDLDWIRPLALCREFLRAGKPQIFFAAQTSLTPAGLTARRRKAIAQQMARGRPEILDEVLPDVTPEALSLCTIECLANLALSM
jgi:hypothetical protein